MNCAIVAVVLLVLCLHNHSQYIYHKLCAMPLLHTMAEKLQIPPNVVLQFLPNENITILLFVTIEFSFRHFIPFGVTTVTIRRFWQGRDA
jgi:hypothetical protein